MKVEVAKPEEMESVAREILKGLSPRKGASVVGLVGDLGSGKTTFTQHLAAILGIKESITSPTFVIEKIYDLAPPQLYNFTKLIHIDAYRLERGEELEQLGFKEILTNPSNLVIIEWPERVAGVLPGGVVIVKFKFINESIREVEYEE